MSMKIYVSEKGLSAEYPKGEDLVIVIEPHAKYYQLYFEISAYLRENGEETIIDFSTESNRYGFAEIEILFTDLKLLEKLLKHAKDELKTLLLFIDRCEYSAKSVISDLKYELTRKCGDFYYIYDEKIDRIIETLKEWVKKNRNILNMDKKTLIKHKIKNGLKEWYNEAKLIAKAGINRLEEYYGMNIRTTAEVKAVASANRLIGEFTITNLDNNALIAKAIYTVQFNKKVQLYKALHELHKAWGYSEVLIYFMDNGQLVNYEDYSFNIKIHDDVIIYDSETKEINVNGKVNLKAKVDDTKYLVETLILKPNNLVNALIYKYGGEITLNEKLPTITINPIGSKFYEVEINGNLYKIPEETIDQILYEVYYRGYNDETKFNEITQILSKKHNTIKSLEKINEIVNQFGVKAQVISKRYKTNYGHEYITGIEFISDDGLKFVINSDNTVYAITDNETLNYICCYVVHDDIGQIITGDETIDLSPAESTAIAKILTIAKSDFPKDDILKRQLDEIKQK